MVSIFDTLVENVITCGVCFKHFDEPRMLSCSHTFCLLCIQQIALRNNGRMECPKNDGTTVEQNEINALPMNEDLRKLVQVLDHPVLNVPKCHRCENANAEHWCDSDCKHSFCGKCWDAIHDVGQYRNHTKLPVRDRPLEMPACKDHTPEDEKSKYWCKGCSKEVCGNCQQLNHKDHDLAVIADIVTEIEQQQENGLQNVQLCLNYRTDRADKMLSEIEKESRNNQEQVTTTMASLRQLINDQEQVLLEEIKNKENNEKRSFEEFKRNLQQEQQGLIKQICDMVDIRRDNQPKKLLEAKETFQQYIKDMDTRLIELKPLTRKKYEIKGFDKVNELQTAIQNFKVAEQRKHENQALQQRINNNTDRSKLSLVNLQLNDMDMEIVAHEIAVNNALKTLELYTNQIGDLGAQYLADALRENNTLTNLQLHENQIGNDGLEHFADALRTNKTLDKLALYGNNITNETAQGIADGLKLNHKMETQIRKVNEIPYSNPALQQRIAGIGNSTSIDWSDSNYNDDDMQIIADMLKNNTTLTCLELYTNKIGDIGAQYLADALKENKTLQELGLYKNKIGDEGARHLAESLRVNKKLQQLYLGGNQIGDQGAQCLADALKVNQSLTVLSLAFNKIGDEGAQQLADALKVNQVLIHLYLHQNQIGDSGAQQLAEALRVNQTLQHLVLQNIQITDTGAQRLAEALRTNTKTILYLENNNISANVKTNLKRQDNRLRFN